MDELNRFVFYGEWLDNIKDLPLDIQDKIICFYKENKNCSI